jgi:hypothetical protein
VIGERVRDKIAASKRKGIWVGGPVPLGFAATDKKAIVVPAQAKTVRPRTIRVFAAGKPTLKGYYRAQFEAAWRSYCKHDVTPSQPKNIRHLRSV